MSTKYAWSGGKCRVPMWMGGCPAGFCDEEAYGPQYPVRYLVRTKNWLREHVPYCSGPACPKHGGPAKGEPIIFRDGWSEDGDPMWCAVMPDFENLQVSPAGFSVGPAQAVGNLRAAIAAAPQAGES